MGCALIAVLLSFAAHPDSLSSSRVIVRGDEARVSIRCQVLSLLEVVPELDADGDGEVTAGEVEARRGEILTYVADHYRLFVGTDRALEGGSRLSAEPLALWHTPPEVAFDIGFRAGSVEAELLFHADEPIRDLMLEVTLFHATSPAHVDLATIEWEGGATQQFGITRSDPRVRYDPEGRGAFKLFLGLGFHHILSGWDHMAFLLALLLGARSLRALLWIVTAFTIAHSVTLALAATRVVDTSAWSGLVEIVIALSIAYVAADNLLHPRIARTRWLEAFVFGLVHGLGFAGFLGRSLLEEQAKVTALVSFNVGVELGQVLVVLVLLLLLRVGLRRESEGESFLAPRVVRRVGSFAVAVLGLFWFVQRI